MKKIFTLFLSGLLFASFTNTSEAQLTQGDIAINAINLTDPDAFQVIALVDIPVNSIISFTDNGWQGTGFRATEGTLVWTTSSTAIIPKGTVITFAATGANWPTTGTPTTNPSSNVGSFVANSGFQFANGGDQLIAYQGTTPPSSNTDVNFLWALSTSNFVASATTAGNSGLPTILNDYSIAFSSSTTNSGNGYFANGTNSTTTVSFTGSKSQLIALLTSRSNYYTSTSTRLDFPVAAIVLPLQLLSFSATPKETTVAFNWKTANERNTKHFKIEQSFNGTEFNGIATVAAAGNSTTEKSYSYTGILNAATTYYRLKMVNIDGKSTTSSVVKVTPSKTGFSLGNVYPIPAKNNITVEWNSNRAGATTLTLTDISGRTIRTLNLQSAQGFNQYNLDVNALTSGQYFLHLKNDVNQVQTIITKQ